MNYPQLQRDPTSSLADFFPVTPSDTADVLSGGRPCRGLLLGSAGAVVLLMANGQQRTIPSGLLQLGVVYPFAFTKVLATGTTSTSVWSGE